MSPIKIPHLSDLVAIDCEMVSVGSPENRRRILAKISLVDSELQALLDEYVAPTEEVTDYKTEISGITEEHLYCENIRTFNDVMNDVKSKLEHKVIIGHALKNDFEVMNYSSHPMHLIRDTAKYREIRDKKHKDSTPSLKSLVKKHLRQDIQSGEHDSIIDARAVVNLYLKFRDTWEKDIAQLASSCSIPK